MSDFKPETASEYLPEVTDACEQALVTVLGCMGSLKDTVRLVGGLVPRYLTPERAPDIPAHAGTSDLDLVIDLAVIAAGQGYAPIADRLKQRGFAKMRLEKGGVSSWQWEAKTLGGVPVRVEFLCDASEEELAKLKNLGAESISVMSMPHMSIAQTLYETKEVKAELLDGKGIAVERVHYANQLAFVVLKAIAFDQRSANKDAGDLVHVLQYGCELEEGARAFAEQFHRGPHRTSLEAALDCMQRGFCTHGDTDGHLMKGAVAFGRFHQPDNTEERLLLQRQASSLVERYVQLEQAAIAQGVH
ncbi:MAG: hypothetical protein Q8M77_16625 [Hydrogenophaga sp.]|nr:hypothetical protein [Hydrogenophaga sp.]